MSRKNLQETEKFLANSRAPYEQEGQDPHPTLAPLDRRERRLVAQGTLITRPYRLEDRDLSVTWSPNLVSDPGEPTVVGTGATPADARRNFYKNLGKVEKLPR